MKKLKPLINLFALFAILIISQSCGEEECLTTCNSNAVLNEEICECECKAGFIGENCNELDPNLEVQDFLTMGVPPLTLLEFSYETDDLYGHEYEGGFLYYIDPVDSICLIAAPYDQQLEGVIWGCSGTSIPGTSELIGTGENNTQLILDNCNEQGIAASVCNDLVLNGKDDWYLPSSDELKKMDVLAKNYSTEIDYGLYSFLADEKLGIVYISSTERDEELVEAVGYCICGTYVLPFWKSGSIQFHIRAIRNGRAY